MIKRLTDKHAISTQRAGVILEAPSFQKPQGEDTNSAWGWERQAGKVGKGDLDPGHFRQSGENARGGVWALAWEVVKEGPGLRGDEG